MAPRVQICAQACRLRCARARARLRDANLRPGKWDPIPGACRRHLGGAGARGCAALVAGGAAAGAWADAAPPIDPRIPAAGTSGLATSAAARRRSAAGIIPRRARSHVAERGRAGTNRPQDPPALSPVPPIGCACASMPPVRPRAAGPAAARQQPNLGAYGGTISRPNMDVIRGGRNNPGQQTQMGVADWSKLFQRPQQ